MGRADEVAEVLRGTAKSLEDVATEAECNDAAFLAALDELVFQCEECDWWCGQDEMSEDRDWVCAECAS